MVKIEATFPKRDNDGIPFRSSMFRNVEAVLLSDVGGYSVYESAGGWVNDEGKEMFDSSFVYCVVVDDMDKAKKVMANLKWMILNDFRQQCAWITYSEINIF